MSRSWGLSSSAAAAAAVMGQQREASAADFRCQRLLEVSQQKEVRKQEEVPRLEAVLKEQQHGWVVVHQTQTVQNRPAERRVGVRKALSIDLLDFLVCK